MKVLDITDFYNERGGGIRSHLELKSRALVELGVDHRVIVPASRDETTELVVGSNGVSAELIRLRGPAQPYDPSYHFLTNARGVREVLHREAPDVVELNSPYLAATNTLGPAPELIGVCTFFWHSNHVDTWAKSTLSRVVPERFAERMVAPLWRTLRRLLDRCDAVITTTQWQTRDLLAHGVERVRCIPFGVNRDVYHPGRRSEEWRREILGANPDAQLFVAVGRLSAEKRFDVVVDAFLRYSRHHDAVLIVFGDGPERAKLEKRATASSSTTSRVAGATATDAANKLDTMSGSIRFMGFERDLTRLATAFASADALIHGCPHETFGLAVAEALSCALPAVVPDAGGAFENAQGPSAEVYRSGDVGACEAAMERLMARDPQELRAAAEKRAETIRPQAAHYREVVALYEELCKAARHEKRPWGRRVARWLGAH